MSKTQFAIALAAATLALPAAAQQRQVVVGYADLNLNTRAGIAALDSRLEAAVRRICGPDSRQLSEHQQMLDCRAATRARAQTRRSVILAQAQRRTGGIAVASAH